MTDNLPAVYTRKPPQMSAKTWAWCCARWPGFADARRAVHATAAYERAQGQPQAKLKEITV